MRVAPLESHALVRRRVKVNGRGSRCYLGTLKRVDQLRRTADVKQLSSNALQLRVDELGSENVRQSTKVVVAIFFDIVAHVGGELFHRGDWPFGAEQKRMPDLPGSRASELDAMSRDLLYALVWATPLEQVAKRFDIYDVALRNRCVRRNIPTPPQGYWQRKEKGYAVSVIALPVERIAGPQ